MRKEFSGLSGMMLCIVLLVGTIAIGGFVQDVAAASKPEGKLVIAVQTLGREIWGPKQQSSDNQLMNSVYEFMSYRDPKTNALVPGLAERWERSQDGLDVTFYLRKGVQFHDGWGEFTAEDVKFTYEHSLEKGTINSRTKGWAKIMKSVEVVNPYQIVFHFKKPHVLFVEEMANTQGDFTIASKKYTEKVGAMQASKHPIGTGPLKFIEVKPGDHIKLEALDNHWRATANFKTFIYKLAPEQSSRIAMLRAGDADITSISAKFKKEVEAAGLKISRVRSIADFFISMGGQVPTRKTYDPSVPWVDSTEAPGRGLKVRKALALAINTQEILEHVMMGEGELLAVPRTYPGMESYDPAWKLYPYDPEQAKRLLAEAGYPNGFGRPLEFYLYESSGRPESPAIGQAVAMFWERIGIKTKIILTDYATMRPTISARKTAWKMWVQGYKSGREPIQAHGSAALHTSANALGGIEDKRIDDLYYKGIGEADVHKRAMITREMGQLFYDNYFNIPICTKHGLFALSKKVGEWPIPPNTLNDCYLELITHAN